METLHSLSFNLPLAKATSISSQVILCEILNEYKNMLLHMYYRFWFFYSHENEEERHLIKREFMS